MDVYEAVKSRRAVRGFNDDPVPREVLERVLSAGGDASKLTKHLQHPGLKEFEVRRTRLVSWAWAGKR
jgi:nitroreductase